MKAKILNVIDEYLLTNPLFCGGVMFSPEIRSQIMGGGGGDYKHFQHHNVN